MANSLRRLRQRKKAEATLNELLEQQSIVNVIHYSCESFYDRKDGTSPRVTSIAVQNLSNGQVASFSIHQIAERNGLLPTELEERYDEFEKQMLEEFYNFVKIHNNFKWLHWNMRDINYGFQALEHRCRVLKGEPVRIPDSALYDLSRIIIDIYGTSYIEHPRMERLMEKNGITKKDFLSGKDEALAFERKDYVKLHQSTLRKVDILSSIANRAWKQTLKTNANWKEMYGSNIVALVEKMTEHWTYKVLGFIGILASLLGLLGLIPLFQSK
jgi:hypothetical protein